MRLANFTLALRDWIHCSLGIIYLLVEERIIMTIDGSTGSSSSIVTHTVRLEHDRNALKRFLRNWLAGSEPLAARRVLLQMKAPSTRPTAPAPPQTPNSRNKQQLYVADNDFDEEQRHANEDIHCILDCDILPYIHIERSR